MGIRIEVLPTITAVGTAGTSATGTQTSLSQLNGLLLAIKVVQANTPHANTDITITCNSGDTTWTLLTLTNNNTASAFYNVRALMQDTVGADITGQYTLLPVRGYVTAVVAQGGSNATCVVTLIYQDD